MAGMKTAREALLAWAKSEGFAAIHNGTATDEQIVDDLLAFLKSKGFGIFYIPELSNILMADYPAPR